ncbi:MAG: FAD-binding oxidoreductase [Actinomycetota bacterium]
MTEHRAIAAIRAQLGEVGVLTGDEAAPFLVDPRGVHVGSALAVVRPASTFEVQAVVEACADHGVAIVPQGGNTGLSGGTAPTGTTPSIVVSLSRMNRIEAVDPHRWSMTVQAGVTIQAMHEAASAADRMFAPDWGARGTATIGGAIATDAGGNNVLRYGNLRDNVLGIEAVLADGRVWDGTRALRKDSSGYDLKQLFIGSEGTLGLVTRAVVRLHPPATHEQSALAAIPGLDGLSELYALAQETAPGLVTAFELVPAIGMRRVCELYDVPRPIETEAPFYVLVKLGSTRPVTDALGTFLQTAAAEGRILDAIVAATSDQEERLWLIRDELPPQRIFPDTQRVGLKMDTAVPVDRMAEYHDAVLAAAADVVPDAVAYGFGHVGDGNLHVMILPARIEDMDAFLAARPQLEQRVDETTIAMGGTLSAEHGVGRHLRTRIRAQKPAVEWELMRSVKHVFDPDGIMNPGALLPAAEG